MSSQVGFATTESNQPRAKKKAPAPTSATPTATAVSVSPKFRHRVPASLFTEVVAAFDCHYMLGLSATAFRREDGMTRLIHISMGDRVHAVDGRMLEASGAVVRPVLEQRPTAFVRNFQGEYARLIKALAEDSRRNRQIAEDVVNLVRQGHQGTVLVVSDRVAHCQALADLLVADGVAAAVLTGQSTPDQRVQVVEAVQAGRVPVLVATLQLIGEGFDCPSIEASILLRPTMSTAMYLQQVGRALRPSQAKERALCSHCASSA